MSSASPRIEPTIGDKKPAPWDVKPEAAPAFELVEDPKDDWGAAKEPSIEEPRLFDREPAPDDRAEPVLLSPEDEAALQENAAPHEGELPGLTEGTKEPFDATLTIPTAESASKTVAGLADVPLKPEPEPAVPNASDASVVPPVAPAQPEPQKGSGFLAFMKKGAEEARSRVADEEREAPTEEQLAAREKTRNRLIGAAAILMAVVVGSSFVLDNETLVKGEANVSTAIPPVPDKATGVEMPTPAATVVSPKNVTPQKVEPPKVVNAAKVPAEKKAEKKVETKAEKKPDAKPVQKAEKKPEKKTPAKAQSGYFIQIVVTSSEAKADRMVRDLKRLKLPAYSEQIKGKKGPLWRVRIGHFKTEKEAKNTVAVLALNGYTGKHYIDKQ